MAKSEVNLWITACTVSIGAHAAMLAAFANLGAFADVDAPTVALPAGESSTLTVYLMTTAEAMQMLSPDVETPDELVLDVPGARLESDVEVVAQSHEPDKPDEPLCESARLSQLESARIAAQQWLKDEGHLLMEFVSSIGDAAKHVARSPATSVKAAPDPQPATVEGTEAKATPGVIVQPVASSANRPPVYPESCRRRGQAGTTHLRLTIDTDGAVSAVVVTATSGNKALDTAACRAAIAWRYAPATEDGKPIRCEIDLPVEFVLKRR